MDEEVEELDEISASTLGSYIRKASKGKEAAYKSREDALDNDDDDKEKVDEAGAFSYGKKPRKGTVAYNAAEQRKKQEKDEKPIEPKDQKVGNAKITKEGAYYDRDTDMYLSNDEYAALNNDYSGMSMNRESAGQMQEGAWRHAEMNNASKKAHADAEEKIKKSSSFTSDTLKDINDKLGNTKKKEVDEANTENKSKKRDYLSKLGADANNKKAGSRKIYPGQNAALKLGRELTKEESELDEGKVDKNNPIYKEYLDLKKNDIKTLRNMISGERRIVDTSEFRSKDHAISTILRDRHGNKKVDQAFGVNEEVELDESSGIHDNASLVKHFGHDVAIDARSHSPAMMFRKGKDGKTYALTKVNNKAHYKATPSSVKEEVNKDFIVKAIKPTVTDDTSIKTIADIKPLRMKLAHFRHHE
jgi:hypothetical protein